MRTSIQSHGKTAGIPAVLVDVLRECEGYFDQRADADCDQDGFIPNEEMKLLAEVRDALVKAKGGEAAEYVRDDLLDHLQDAGKKQTAIIRRAQAILTKYLQGQPSGLSRDEAIHALLGLLDGPEQREAQEAFDAAIAKAEGGAA